MLIITPDTRFSRWADGLVLDLLKKIGYKQALIIIIPVQ